MRSSLLGLFFAIGIIAISVNDTISNLHILFNVVGLIVVLGGTVSAGIITFGIRDMLTISFITLRVFSRPKVNTSKVINEMIEISLELEKNPNAYPQLRHKNYHPFIKDGLRLIENGFTLENIESILTSDLENRKGHQIHQVEILKTLAKYPPAFGMIGTVIGLIGLMNSLGNTEGESLIGPSMAIALLTTLYGLLAANYIFIPLSDNLLHRTNAGITLRKTIIEGILLIKEKEDPVHLREYLTVHIPPRDRHEILSLELA